MQKNKSAVRYANIARNQKHEDSSTNRIKCCRTDAVKMRINNIKPSTIQNTYITITSDVLDFGL